MSKLSMGLGNLGQNEIRFIRKFRWTFSAFNYISGLCLPEGYVKVAARPNLTIEETETEFLNGKTWIPGKAQWEEMAVTYFDTTENDNEELYKFLSFDSKENLFPSKFTGVLKLYDGCGQVLEGWKLDDAYVTSMNFGELDFSSNETVTIELKIRYKAAEYYCPGNVTLEAGVPVRSQDKPVPTWMRPAKDNMIPIRQLLGLVT